MTPSARIQAAIEILDLVIAAARSGGAPADRVVTDWFRARRFAGSGDRRAVRELVYGAIRACGEIPASGRAAMLRLAEGDAALTSLFDGSRHAPAPISADDKSLVMSMRRAASSRMPERKRKGDCPTLRRNSLAKWNRLTHASEASWSRVKGLSK